MSRGELETLEETLGHRFSNPQLLGRALTHASALANGRHPDPQSYQRLEFLGDRVLGLVVADMLDRRFPDATEGELSKRLARLVSRTACEEVAEQMQLGEFIRTGVSLQRGRERVTAGMLADVCEALLGALYKDGGLAAARPVIERYWSPRIDAGGGLRDAKTELQEWAHRRGFDGPSYVEIMRSGPDHSPKFEIEVFVGELCGRGRGRSKRSAEQADAADLLRSQGAWNEP
jgi:ribonuclease-3